jgi:Ser/Thr protein kinase RdoA (MazF antagonist)
MPDAPDPDTDLVAAHTTVDAGSIARRVERHHGLSVRRCHLLRRNLNDNYALQADDGTRYVARLYAIRPRGEPNVDFEAALLSHLDARGAGVAAMVPALDGHPSVSLRCPEGPRPLALFQHVPGSVPDTEADFALTGAELARIHRAARDYAGPPSRYPLDGPRLAGRALRSLQAHPELDPALVDTFDGVVRRLLEEWAEVADTLSTVLCHGDTHGFNKHVFDEGTGTRRTVFFDFDDAGPGCLAYDLCVMPWSYLYRKGLESPDDTLRERWAGYVGAYRDAGGEVTDSDLAAIPLCLQLRHLWNIGEGVARVHHWGAMMMSADWLRRQPGVCEAWRSLDLRV